MKAYLYLDAEGYMAFDTGQNFLKFLVPKQLTMISEIKTFNDGYLVMDTNYGEEYVDLNAVANEIGLRLSFKNIIPVLGRA